MSLSESRANRRCSASAPVFAAIVSRLNAARLEDGLPKLGFLNPWLYSLNQTGFTDIIDGGSSGCYLAPATSNWFPMQAGMQRQDGILLPGLGRPFIIPW